MKLTITAKFRCWDVTPPTGENIDERVTLQAVTSDSEENKAWSRYTPDGRLTMAITNPAIHGAFVKGKDYLLTINPFDYTARELAIPTARGEVGYKAYALSTGGKTFDGRDMPAWEELPERIRGAWEAAASAIVGAAT